MSGSNLTLRRVLTILLTFEMIAVIILNALAGSGVGELH